MEYQSRQNNLELLIKMDFKVNWTLLKIGYFGFKNIHPMFYQQEIIDYAIKHANWDDNEDPVTILACSGNDKDFFEKTLNDLSNLENNNVFFQERKIRAFIVSREIEELPDDYTDGLIKLTELWLTLGVTGDCPHLVQGVGNALSPMDYYTEKMYLELKKKNCEWLNNEIEFILSNE